MYHVYILKCLDNNHYIGCTSNLQERMQRHRSGYVKATKGKLPVKLLSYIAFSSKYKAYEFEKYLKSGSGRGFVNKHFI